MSALMEKLERVERDLAASQARVHELQQQVAKEYEEKMQYLQMLIPLSLRFPSLNATPPKSNPQSPRMQSAIVHISPTHGSPLTSPMSITKQKKDSQ